MRLLGWVLLVLLPIQMMGQDTKAQLDSLDKAFRTFLSTDWDSAQVVLAKQLELTNVKQIDHLRGRALKNLADYLRRAGEMDSSIITYEKVFRISKELGDSVLTARMMGSIASVYLSQGKNVQASYKFEEAIPYFEAARDTIGLGITYQKLGKAQRHMGQFDKAINSYLRSNQLLYQDNFIQLRLGNLNGIGLIYKEIGKTEKALKIFREAIQANPQSIQEPGIFDVFANMFIIYLNEDSDSAKLYLDKGFDIANRFNIPTFQLMSYQDIALYFEHLGLLDSTVFYLKKAQVLAKSLDRSSVLIRTNMGLAKAYGQQGKSRKSEVILLSTLQLAEQNAEYVEKAEITKHLHELYKNAGQPGKALTYLEKHLAYIKDQYSKEQIEKFKEAELSFEFRQKQMADSLRAAQAQQIADAGYHESLAKEQQQRTMLYAFLIVIGLAGAFALYGFTTQRRQANALAVRNDKIETLLKEIHHRVKNNLQVVSSLLDLQSMEIEDEELVATFQEGKNRVAAMGLIHQQLYQHDHLASVDFKTYADQLADELSKLYGKEGQINYQVKTSDDVQLDVDTAIPLGLILNELISNAYKYAFDEKEEGQILIELNKANGENQLTVSDNGKGLPDSFDWKRAKSLGLRLVRNLSKQIRGKATYQYDGGSVFTISFRDISINKQITKST